MKIQEKLNLKSNKDLRIAGDSSGVEIFKQFMSYFQKEGNEIRQRVMDLFGLGDSYFYFLIISKNL